jgi:hypothetical protein
MDQGIGTPEAAPKKTNTTLIIIIVVVALLLCCCCLIVVLGYLYGDQVLQWLGYARQFIPHLPLLV